MESKNKNRRESLVSVIMPAYNSGRYIGEAIESVISQTYKNWELIITDDGSVDETVEIVKRYAAADKRVKLVIHEGNKGVAAARNTALYEVQGRYIAFLDSNDMWTPDKLLKQVAFMESKGCYISYTGYLICGKDGEPRKVVEVPLFLNHRKALGGNKMGCLTVMVDLSRIHSFKMIDMPHEDYATWLYILKQGYVAYGINEPLGKYRELEGSISSNKKKALIWHWNVYRKSQKMNVFSSGYYFLKYAFHGVIKKYI